MSGLKMEGVSLEEVDTEELRWHVAEDADTAHKYHTEQEKLLEYLYQKAEERRKLLE